VRLTVVDPSRSNDAAESLDVASTPGLDNKSVLWVPIPTSVSPSALDNFLVDTTPDWALRSDITILGVHPRAAADLTPDVMDDVAFRLEGGPLYLMTHDNKSGLPGLDHARGKEIPGLDGQSLTKVIQQGDVGALMLRVGSHLPASENVHYEAPNGRHYRAFLRPGFSMRTVEDLDRMSFWLLPHLIGRDRILVDHWSLLSLGYHAAQYAQGFSGATDRLHVDTLHSYDEPVELLETRLRRTLGDPTDGRACIMVSVNSSGHTAHEVLLPAVAHSGHSNARIVALAQTPDAERPLEALTNLGAQFERHPITSCPSCASGNSVAVPIQHDSYLLKLAAYTRVTAIRRQDTRPIKTMIERYAGIGMFSVHRDHADARHHAYHVDVEPMLRTRAFAGRLTEALSTLQSKDFDLLIHPPLANAEQFASKLRKKLGIGSVLATDERLERDPEIATAVANAQRILIVDDVVITGRRLIGYRRAIDNLHELGTQDVDVTAIVAVARPSSPRKFQAIRDVVHHTGQSPRFFAVETLYLPNWRATECPWCRELRTLERLTSKLQKVPFVSQRITRLREKDGLRDNLYLDLPAGSVAGADRRVRLPRDAEEWDELASRSDVGYSYWQLNPGSVFGDVQGADLATSVAAALQRLRFTTDNDGNAVESELDEYYRSPISKVLDPRLYILGRFYEPVLLAAILRATRTFDLKAPGEPELAAGLSEHATYLTSSRALAGELLFHMATHHLPAVPELLGVIDGDALVNDVAEELFSLRDPLAGD
jgi:hypothetical protein